MLDSRQQESFGLKRWVGCWGELTDDEPNFIAGQRERLINKQKPANLIYRAGRFLSLISDDLRWAYPVPLVTEYCEVVRKPW